jgi:RND family efflux transporter MFP subunit
MKTIQIVLVAIAAFIFTSCTHKESALPADVAYYTCTMHPSVHSLDPNAKCPICGMSLVPVKKSAATNSTAPAHEHGAAPSAHQHGGTSVAPQHEMTAMEQNAPTEFTVPIERQQMIGVTYTNVERRPIDVQIRTPGIVAYDKQRHFDYVSRVDGYVQKLNVSSRGDVVEKDQPLLTIYSPDLLVAQGEYVNALRSRDQARESGLSNLLQSANRMVQSARQRLNLWNISDVQLSELEKTREAKNTLTLYSPAKGVVQDIPIDQGRHVNIGDHLVDVVDLSVVWVWAEFYQDELPLLKKGAQVIVSSSAIPDATFKGKIDLVDPFLNDAKRTARARISVENPEFKLRPEMYVDTTLQSSEGTGLAIPASAVLPTGTRNVVFVNKGDGKLEPRFVELGRSFGNLYVVKSGLIEGEQIVASANFLIDAEAKVQGALKQW